MNNDNAAQVTYLLKHTHAHWLTGFGLQVFRVFSVPFENKLLHSCWNSLCCMLFSFLMKILLKLLSSHWKFWKRKEKKPLFSQKCKSLGPTFVCTARVWQLLVVPVDAGWVSTDKGGVQEVRWNQRFKGSFSVLCSFWHFPKKNRKCRSLVQQTGYQSPLGLVAFRCRKESSILHSVHLKTCRGWSATFRRKRLVWALKHVHSCNCDKKKMQLSVCAHEATRCQQQPLLFLWLNDFFRRLQQVRFPSGPAESAPALGDDLPVHLRNGRDFMSRWSFSLSPRNFYSYFWANTEGKNPLKQTREMFSTTS